MNSRNFNYLSHVECVLRVVSEWGEPVPKSEIAILCNLSHAYAMGLLDGLVVAGLVAYEYPEPSRYVLVSITEAGLELLEKSE